MANGFTGARNDLNQKSQLGWQGVVIALFLNQILR
jgi:hypothetical protein